MQLLGFAKSVSAGAVLMSATVVLAYPQQNAAPSPPPAPVIQTQPEVLNLDALAMQGEQLLAKARAGNGSAGITLAHYRGHYTMLTARTKAAAANCMSTTPISSS